MKKSFGLLAFAMIVGLSFSNCTNELETQQGNNGTYEVKFVTDIEGLSRTSINEGATSTSFTKQDAIGIFAYDGEKIVGSNIKYVYDGSKWTSDNAIAAKAGVQYKYYAYYPYKEGVTDPKEISVAVNADQSNGISMDDFLTAQNETSAPGAETISLKFDHAFSLVQVSFGSDLLSEEGEEQPTITSVSLESILPTVTVNAVTGEISEPSGNISSIKMEKAKNVDLFRAIVPAQTLNKGAIIMSITDGKDRLYDVRYNNKLSYQKGEGIQITVNKLSLLPTGTDIVITKDITGWTGSAINDGIAVTEIPFVQPITANELTEVVADTRSFNEESWFKLVQGDTERGRATFEIVNDNETDWGKAAKMTYNIKGEETFNNKGEASFNNSWYKAAIGYNHTEPMYVTDDIYIYKVTAKIKSDVCEGTTTKSAFSFTCKAKSAERYTWSFAASTKADSFTSTTVNKTPAKSGVWEEFTFYINFKQVSSTIGTVDGSTSKYFVDATKDDYNGFDLRIYTNNKNLKPTIYISDVKIEQYIPTK